ncbi:MAG: hypothetical protein JWP11_1211, partial [Frankiales bacterium]|nr:hypothetical protein [Frankiales bacterium]
MSRRLLVSSGAAALALVLAVPSAALACEKGGGGESGGSSSSESRDKGDHGKKTKDESTTSDQGKKDGSAKSHATRGSSSGAASSGSDSKDAGHNPPGNNGTIKIDYAAPADSGHANRPHPGCAFQLRMFDFDTNQYGSITFEGQAPTKLGTLLTQPHMLLSNDAAGGGQDVDETYSYTAAQLGLIGKPQAKQGWHIKVSVNADNAPGGAKHKVFWLTCAAAAAPAPATGSASGSGTTTQTGTTSGAATATQPEGAAPQSITSGTSAGAATAAGSVSAAAPLSGGGAA